MAEQITLKDPYREKRIYQMRVVVIGLFVVALLLVVVGCYFSLQITQHDNYKTQSDRNRVQLQAIPPKRGLIYDRNGSLLAENLPSYSLTIVKEQVENLDDTIAMLQQLLDINEDHIKKFKRHIYIIN